MAETDKKGNQPQGRKRVFSQAPLANKKNVTINLPEVKPKKKKGK